MGAVGRWLWLVLRGAGRLLLWVGVTVALVLSFTLDLLRQPAAQAHLVQQVQQQTRDLLPGLSLGQIAGDYTTGLELSDVVLRDRFGGEAIRAQRVRLSYDLRQLLHGVLQLKQVELVRPRVRVAPTRTGQVNLAELLVPQPEQPPPPPSEPTDMRLVLGQLRIHQGRVTVAGPDGTLRLQQLELDLGARAALAGADVELRQLAARVTLPNKRTVTVAIKADAGLTRERVRLDLDGDVGGDLLPTGPLALRVRAKGPHQRVVLQTAVTLKRGGRVIVDGSAGLGPAGKPSFNLVTRVEHLGLAPLLGPDAAGATLTSRVRASGEGIPLEAGSRADVQLSSQPMTLKGLRLGQLKLAASTRGPRWELGQLAVALAGASVTARGKGTLQRMKVSARVRAPSLQRVRAGLRPLAKLPALQGRLLLDAGVEGPLAGPLRASLRLRGDELQLDKMRLQRIRVAAGVHGLPTAPAGQVKLTLERLDPGDPRLRVSQATLEVSGRRGGTINLQLAARGPELRAKLAADTILSGGAKRIATTLRELHLRHQGQTLALANEPTVRLVPAAGSVDLSPTTLRVLGGTVKLQARVRQRGGLRVEARVAARGVRPPRIGGRAELDARLALTPRLAQAHVSGELSGGRGALALDATVPLRRRRGGPTLDGRRDGQVALRLKRISLGLLRQAVPGLPAAQGQLSLSADAKGPLLQPDVAAELTLADAGIEQVRGVDASVRVKATPDQTSLTSHLARGGNRLLQLSAMVPQGTRLIQQGLPPQSQLIGQPVQLQLQVPPTQLATLRELLPALEGMAGTVSTQLALSGSLIRPQLRLRAQLKGGSLDHGQLVPGDVAVGLDLRGLDGAVETHLTLDRERQRVLVGTGRVGADVSRVLQQPGALRPQTLPLQLSLELPGLALKQLATLSPAAKGIAGRLQGKVSVNGTLEAPAARLSLNLSKLRVTDVAVGQVQLSGRLQHNELSTRAAILQPAGGRLSWQGALQLAPEPRVDGRLQGQALDLGFLAQLAPALRKSAGKLNLALQAKGALLKPRVVGHVALTDGRLDLRGVSPLKQIGLRVDLQPGQVRLSRLELAGDRGTLRAHGTVALTSETLDVARGPALLKKVQLKLKAQDLGIDAGTVSGAVVSADVDVGGGMRKNRLTLKVGITDAVVKVPKIEGGRDLHPTALPQDVELTDLKRQQGAAGATVAAAGGASPLGLDVRVGADPVFVRGEDLDLEVASKLRARTDAKGRVRITGRVEIRRGRIKALNNTFEVRQAVVSFSGEPNPDPGLNVLLAREGPEATVLVQLTGTASAPELALRSDPPIYDESQILSLLLTGRVDARPDSGGGGDKAVAVANAVGQALVGGVIGKQASKVGIDVVRVGLDENKDQKTGESSLRAQAEVGKYITERLYVGYRRVFGASVDENANEGLMEYRISARWLLSALFGDAGVGGLDLIWNLRY